MKTLTAESVSVDALQASVRTAIDSGRIGQPVNVRLHWQAGSQRDDVADAAKAALQLVESILDLSDAVVTTRSVEGGQLLHALVRDSHGRSALISIAPGVPATLALTVYGNHGVVRLEETAIA